MVKTLSSAELARALIWEFHSHIDDNKAIAGKCGAIEAIVSVMKAHPDNAGMCQGGCWALQAITTNSSKSCHSKKKKKKKKKKTPPKINQ